MRATASPPSPRCSRADAMPRQDPDDRHPDHCARTASAKASATPSRTCSARGRRSSRCSRSRRPTTRWRCCLQAREFVAAARHRRRRAIFSDIYGASPCNLVGKLLNPGRVEDCRGQPADAGARLHLPHRGHGDDGQEGGFRRLRRRAAHGAWTRSMPQREVEIINKLGLHARASPSSRNSQRSIESDVRCRATAARSTRKASWA